MTLILRHPELVEGSAPSESYMKQREELSKREASRIGLVTSINRYLDDGVLCYVKKDLGYFGKHNWPVINEYLTLWESQELLRIVKPINEASDSDVVIEMLHYINQEDYPNWPVKKT